MLKWLKNKYNKTKINLTSDLISLKNIHGKFDYYIEKTLVLTPMSLQNEETILEIVSLSHILNSLLRINILIKTYNTLYGKENVNSHD